MIRSRLDISRRQGEYTYNLMRSAPHFADTFGLALALIGLGSAFYHASLTFVGQVLDVQSMYMLITFALLYNLSRLHMLPTRFFVGSYLAVNLILLLAQVTVPGLRRLVFASLILVVLEVERRIRARGSQDIEGRLLVGAILLLGIGFVIWVLDNMRFVCSPASIFQGHALWHILGSLAAGSLYMYYRSENTGEFKRAAG